MHGLTGGSWKRSRHRATATEKNDPTGNRVVTNGSVPYRRSTPPRQLSTLHVVTNTLFPQGIALALAALAGDSGGGDEARRNRGHVR
jgi:hypothetical protein